MQALGGEHSKRRARAQAEAGGCLWCLRQSREPLWLQRKGAGLGGQGQTVGSGHQRADFLSRVQGVKGGSAWRAQTPGVHRLPLALGGGQVGQGREQGDRGQRLL